MSDRARSADVPFWGEGDDSEALDRYRTLVDAVDDGIYQLDSTGHFVGVNDTIVEIAGYSREELLGEHVSLVLAEADVDRIEREFGRRLATGETDGAAFETAVETADGEFLTCELRISLIVSDGEFRGSTGIVRDVTERKRRERRLENELDRVFGRISDAFYAVDDEFRFTHVNARAEELLHHSEEELLGRSLWEVFPAAAAIDDVRGSFERALDEQRRTSYELYYDTLDFWVEANLYPSETGVSVYFRDVTERKKRERELERYEKTIETIWDGVATLDADGRFVVVNKALCEMTGYDRDELLDEHVTLIHDETVDELAEELNEGVITGERAYGAIEFDLELASGDAIPVEGRFGPYELEDGSVGRTGVVRDISGRKERERELTKYETIVETVNDGIYTVDEDGRFTMVNDAYAELTGYSREELLDSHASLVVDDETFERAKAVEGELSEGRGDEPILEATVRTADGDRVPAEATFAMLPDDGHERIGVARDITDRKERERALEESERRYRTLVENFPNGAVGLYDEELTYTVVGGEMLSDLGVSPEEMVDSSIDERYPDDLVEEVKPHLRAVFDGESHSFEVAYRDRQLLAHALPVRDADDEIYAGMLMVRDITERTEYRRRLEESNERLEQFAYIASHDLQEPLRMVTSYLGLIDDRYGGALDEDGEEFLAFAIDGAERMREMIDGLLKYSRIERTGTSFEPVDLGAVLDAVLTDLQVRIDENDAEIAVDELPRVAGDSNQLRQLFQNLVENAIAYSGDDPPRVAVSAERDGGRWLVSVRDEGIGIDPDDTDRIFEVFQRLHSHEDHPGTGIGLALCQRIVERHGGEIGVESEPDEGTTFAFTLPAANA
ncbi:PAS domain S-box protein [Halosolutus gelatinilyticus]|uniref:PAS domain S-box protein n=1 Tax=Halosolutus gelatinilyticus TaxID=2931975 RepID=UPI001FF27527|nr:PAS domain S-box protein [Halosolutus gelatinilyticus]